MVYLYCGSITNGFQMVRIAHPYIDAAGHLVCRHKRVPAPAEQHRWQPWHGMRALKVELISKGLHRADLRICHNDGGHLSHKCYQIMPPGKRFLVIGIGRVHLNEHVDFCQRMKCLLQRCHMLRNPGIFRDV